MEALIPISFFFSIAAVLILRPISRKLGLLLEAMSRERAGIRADDGTAARTLALMEQMNRRLELMEERLDFTERLVERTDRRRVRRDDPLQLQRS